MSQKQEWQNWVQEVGEEEKLWDKTVVQPPKYSNYVRFQYQNVPVFAVEGAPYLTIHISIYPQ